MLHPDQPGKVYYQVTNHHCQQHTEAWQDLHVPEELLAWLCRERPESVTLRNELFRHQNKPLYIKLTLVVVFVAGWGLDPSGFLHIVSVLKPKNWGKRIHCDEQV